MEDPKLLKFSWGKTFKFNSGHNKNEWGLSNEDEKESSVKPLVEDTIKNDLKIIPIDRF